MHGVHNPTVCGLTAILRAKAMTNSPIINYASNREWSSSEMLTYNVMGAIANSDVPIATDRCILSPLTEADFCELTPLLTNADVRRYLGGVRPVEDSFHNMRESIATANNYPFVVRLCGTTELLGLVTIAPHHEPTDMEISYMFLPEHWGKGYAQEAMKAVLNFCEQKLNLNRVVSETQTANHRSCRLLETLGYCAESKIERFGAKQTIYAYQFRDGVAI